jgi:CRISPR-associated endonuclease Cas2
MHIHIVSYDLDKPGQVYPKIINRLTALGAKRVQFSQWMLKSSLSAEQLRDDLLKYIDANDRLLVIDVTSAPMAWHNLEVQIKTTFNLT